MPPKGGHPPRDPHAWHAENFATVNRPDLRLVVDGKGTLALGSASRARRQLRIDEGRIDYSARVGSSATTWSSSAAPRKDRRSGLARRAARLDLDVDLGPAVEFSGGGLETALKVASGSRR